MKTVFNRICNILVMLTLILPLDVLSSNPAMANALQPLQGSSSISSQFLYSDIETRDSLISDVERSTTDNPTRVIIQFKDDPVAQYIKTQTGSLDGTQDQDLLISNYRQRLLNTHHNLINDLISQNITFQVQNEFIYLYNALVLTINVNVINYLMFLPDVEAVHIDREVRAHLNQSISIIGANDVWADYGVTGQGVTVAVIDTGVNYYHPDLGGCLGSLCRVVGGFDYVNNDSDPMDDNGHGTHVAGIIGASGSITGVAPGASLLAYKALDSNGTGYQSYVIASLETAANPDGDPLTEDGADIANLSLGGFGYSNDPLVQAVNNAVFNGMIVVVSAGNDGPDDETIDSPGIASLALTVGSTSKTDALTSYSSRGPAISWIKPSIVAPGELIVSTAWKLGALPSDPILEGRSGTSMAAPHVAGAAALLRELYPDWETEDIYSALINSADTLDLSVYLQGSGRLNVNAAAQAGVSISPSLADFGWVDQTEDTWNKQLLLDVKNLSTQSLLCSISVEQPVPAGLEINLSPTSRTINAGSNFSFSVQAGFDMVAVDTGTLEGEIDLTCGDLLYRVPYGMVISPYKYHVLQSVSDTSTGWFSHSAYIVDMDGNPATNVSVTYSVYDEEDNLLFSHSMTQDESTLGKWISDAQSMHLFGYGIYKVRTNAIDDMGREGVSEFRTFEVGTLEYVTPPILWQSYLSSTYNAGLELVDLDNNNIPEVVWMRSDGIKTYSNSGNLIWENSDQIFHVATSTLKDDNTRNLVGVGGGGLGFGTFQLINYSSDGQQLFTVPIWSDTDVVVCDLDGDGADEYVAGTYGGINVYSHDGNLEWTYPLNLATHSLRFLGNEMDCVDLDNDSKDELIIGYWNGELFILEDQTAIPVRNWFEKLVPVSNSTLMGVDAHENGQAIAVGYGGVILYYDGGSWSAMSSGTSYTLRDVSWRQDGKAIAVGDTGTVLFFDGTAWSKMSFPGYNSLEAVIYNDDNTAIAVGIGVYYYDGVSWINISVPTSDSLSGVTSCPDGQVFAVGGGGTILRYDGSIWERMESPTTAWLTEVACSANGDVVAVGYGSNILWYDGEAWLTLNRFGYFFDVDFNEENEAVAVDQSSATICISTGCKDMQIPQILLPNPVYLYAIAAYGPSSFIVAGQNGTTFRYGLDQHLKWIQLIQYDVPQIVKAGDIDQDGSIEVVAVGNRICVFEATGTLDWCSLPPTVEYDTYEALDIRDILPSPGLELIITKGRGEYTEVWSSIGELLWRQNTYLGSCLSVPHQALGDLDGDGSTEIVVASNYKAIIFSPYGNRKALVTIPNGTQSILLKLANLDSGHELEILALTDNLYTLSTAEFLSPVQADFTSLPNTGLPPLNVSFTNTSTGSHSMYGWDFGDGNISTEENPTHLYQTAGVYNVTFTASGLGGTDTETKTNYITVYTSTTADFSADPITGIAPLDVTFTNLSSGIFDTCTWNFGDGGTSSICNPAHSYATPGSYTVSLTISGLAGTDTETKTSYITIYAPAVADFSADPTTGIAPLDVTFTNLSSGIYDTCNWNFGDGGTSSICNPAHSYATPGIYTVSLTINGMGGLDTVTKVGMINVTDGTQTIIEPDSPSTLVYTDVSGSSTTLDIPAEAVTDTTLLVYTPVETVPIDFNFQYADYAFNLDAYQDGEIQEDFTFELPVSVTVTYSDGDIENLDETSLQLLWWDPSLGAWINAACGDYERYPDEDLFIVPICHLSLFAVFGNSQIEEFEFYLPIVIRKSSGIMSLEIVSLPD